MRYKNARGELNKEMKVHQIHWICVQKCGQWVQTFGYSDLNITIIGSYFIR